ncbi:MAG: chemotaxis protein CheW [Denitrovibrio sp.]|nr:MAG: chemotaxis protein CheW [Denitrovibrio sp.]
MSDNIEKSSVPSASLQVLTFELAGEVYGVDINSVKEVLEYDGQTKIPKMPDFMSGVINIRGHVLPVVDMRVKFGLKKGERTVNTCVVVIDTELDGDRASIGALVDSVREVVTFSAADIEAAPRIGTQLNTEFIHGMAKTDEGFVIILKLEAVFSQKEMEAVAAIAPAGKAE